MAYLEEDYYMDIDVFSMEDVNAIFDIKDILEDFYGVDDMKRSGEGYRCSCPIHGGSNPGAMAVYTDRNICYSFTENRSFTIIGLMNYYNNRGNDNNRNNINKKKSIFELCNYYGVDPEDIPGIYKRQYEIPGQKKDEDKIEEPEIKPQPKIVISPAMLKLFGMSRNPFENPKKFLKTNETVTTNDGRQVKKTIPYMLSDKEASYLVYEGLKRFSRAAAIIGVSGKEFLNKSKLWRQDGNFLFSGSFIKLLQNIMGEYKDIEKKCKEIGFKKPPEEIIKAQAKRIDKDMHIKRYDPFIEEEGVEFSVLIKNDGKEPLKEEKTKLPPVLDAKCTEMDEKDIPDYLQFDSCTKTSIWKKEDIPIHNGRAYCPTKEDYLSFNEKKLSDWLDEIKNFERNFEYVLNFAKPLDHSAPDFDIQTDIYIVHSLIMAEKEITEKAIKQIYDEKNREYFKDNPVFMIDKDSKEEIEEDFEDDYDRD